MTTELNINLTKEQLVLEGTKSNGLKFHLWTIGCQMNVADSERMQSALTQLGLSSTNSPDEADVIVLNSCVVRQSAEDKVTGQLTSLKPLKKPDQIIALMGCMVGPDTKLLKKKFPHVDVFMRPQEYDPLLELIGKRIGIDPAGCVGQLLPKIDTRAYIPIIHGCDLFCSFCIIPYRRGRQVSRQINEIAHEAVMLVDRGVKEITLLGQTVDAYGHDLETQVDLSDLLYRLDSIEGLERIRFLTSHPQFMSDQIIDAVAALPKVCEHINLPIQAGDDVILKSMRRTYNVEEYRNLVNRIRSKINNVSITTDIIVGFCGETKEQFQNTLKIVEEMQFDKIHLAAYSPREGTIAFRKQIDDVPYAEKKLRVQELEELQKEIVKRINLKYLNSYEEVLIDGHERGKWKGRTRTDKLVFIDSNKSDLNGKMENVKITNTSAWSLKGIIA